MPPRFCLWQAGAQRAHGATTMQIANVGASTTSD